MLNYQIGDITSVTSGVVVHGCNCSGGFGSGVAGAILRKWPIVAKVFHQTPPCPELLTQIQVVRVDHNLFVINGFTQLEFGSDGKIYADEEAVLVVIDKAIDFAMTYNLPLHMPKIGCGLGGLDWEEFLKPFVEAQARNWKDLEINVWDLE